MNLHCQSCGAALLLEARHRTALCPYCASSSVLERPPSPDAPTPTFALGFSQTAPVVQAQVKRWLQQRSWFCESGVKNASLERLRGVYVPAYLYTTTVRVKYSVWVGEEYKKSETYTTTRNGRTVQGSRTVVDIQWYSLSGTFATYASDVLVTASRGLPNKELEAIEPFDLRLLHRHSPAMLSGWIAEEPSLSHRECIKQARAEIAGTLAGTLASFMPGDKHKGLGYKAEAEHESLDLVSLPVWVLAARYGQGKPPFRVIVNGQTGEVHGHAPLSLVRIGFAIFAALVALAILVVGLSSCSHAH